jgi:antitoxin MazE
MIRIPNQLLTQLNLKQGDQLTMHVRGRTLILSTLDQRKADTNKDLYQHLQNLVAQIDFNAERHNEVEFGLIGNEQI